MQENGGNKPFFEAEKEKIIPRVIHRGSEDNLGIMWITRSGLTLK